MDNHTTPESQEQFKYFVILQFYIAMRDRVEDNFDAVRFNFDGVDRSNEFQRREHAFYLDWFFTNQDEIYEAYSHLEDDESRAIYKDLLVYRLVGHLHYRVRSSVHTTQDKWNALAAIAVGQESQLETTGMLGALKHYDFEWQGKRYTIDCMENGLLYSLARGQYFFERDGVRIQPEEGEYVVDGGACLGDTALVFSNAVGPSGRVYSFDPVEDNLEVCAFNVAQFALDNVTVFPFGLSHENVDAAPIRLNTYAPGFSSGNAAHNNMVVPLRSLDSLVKSGEIEGVDFIKLDIEGAEMETLVGAKETIDTFSPKMALSLHHRPDDFFQIINYLKHAHPQYQLYLGHYTIHREETVLYCLPS